MLNQLIVHEYYNIDKNQQVLQCGIKKKNQEFIVSFFMCRNMYMNNTFTKNILFIISA